MTAPTAHKAQRPDRAYSRRSRRSRRRPIALAIALAGLLAVVYVTGLLHSRPAGGTHLALWPIVALGTWAAACYKVPVRDRRANFSISLTGIPLLLALPFLPPALALAAFFSGRLAAQLQGRRPFDKALISSLVSVLDMAVGTVVYDALIGRQAPGSEMGWLAVALTITLVSISDLGGVVLVAAIYNWRWRPPPIGRALAHAGLDLVLSAAGGLAAISLVPAGVWVVALFAALVGLVDVGWRRAAVAAQRQAALHRLYVFTQRLALAQGGERELVATVLEGTRSLLSAGRAVLAVPLEAPLDELMLRCSVDGDGLALIEEAVQRDEIARLVADRGPFAIGTGGQGALTADAVRDGGMAGVREAIVAPLRPGDPRTGYVLVANPLFRGEGFVSGDLELLGKVAANAAVALRRGGLVDKLRHEAAVRDHEARHDRLTGLPNRQLLSEQLDAALRLPSDATPAVVTIDLDAFSQVNDTLGRGAGDQVLLEVARRLGVIADERNFVSRSGDDEFTLLLSDSSLEDETLESARAFLATIAKPLQVGGLELIIRASAGVARPARGSSAADALHQAESAVRRAKAHGGGAERYTDDAGGRGSRRIGLARELRKAIDNGALSAYYQPVVRTASGSLSGFEALARWGHEELGDVPPERFVRVAEEAGLIDSLTWWVLEAALSEVKIWRTHRPELAVSVNLSPASLYRSDLRRRVAAALEAARVPPNALRLELTETSATNDMAKRALGQLSELGVGLSIDDFGTGYSSFSRLRSLPFDEVKIDRSFVSRMCWVAEDDAVVRSVIELARGLGKTAAAEGVEDGATLERLAALGCQKAQGYYLGPPLPAEECRALLTAGHARPWGDDPTPSARRPGEVASARPEPPA